MFEPFRSDKVNGNVSVGNSWDACQNIIYRFILYNNPQIKKAIEFIVGCDLVEALFSNSKCELLI